MKDKEKYFVETENLAFPEIHTGKVKQISAKNLMTTNLLFMIQWQFPKFI